MRAAPKQVAACRCCASASLLAHPPTVARSIAPQARDGRGGPLFQYARAAAQVALLLRPTSDGEFDAVLRRIERSTRTFGDGPTSTSYLERALLPLTSIGTAR